MQTGDLRGPQAAARGQAEDDPVEPRVGRARRLAPQIGQDGGQFPAGENLRGVDQAGISGLHRRFSQRCEFGWRGNVPHASDSQYLRFAEKASEFGPSSRMMGPTLRHALRRTLTVMVPTDSGGWASQSGTEQKRRNALGMTE